MDYDELLRALLSVWLTLLGLMVGSFLNVVIARVPHRQSVVRPRSRCPRCGHQLSWFENIPVVSWLFLRGKCRSCRLPISLRYPAIELLTGFLYFACLNRLGWTLELALAITLVSLLVPLTFIDLEHWILPFELTIPGIVTALVLSLIIGVDRFIESAIGAGLGFLSFWLLEWVGEKVFKKEALGGGDKYLLAMLGAFLTYRPLLGLAFLASTQGAIVGSLLLWIRGRAGPAPAAVEPPPAPEAGTEDRPEHKDEEEEEDQEEDDWVPGPTNIPFGPWLALAGVEVLLIAPEIASLLPAHLGWFLGAGLP